MPWGKLCGTYSFHPKILVVGNEGAGAHARMISYAAEHLTGGKLPCAVALAIAPRELLDRLVAVRLLDLHGEDYVIHDFGDYNPSGERLAEHREELRQKRADAGRKGAAARWGQGKQDGNLPSDLPSGLPGKGDGKTDGKTDGKNMAPSPSPSPSPPSPSGMDLALTRPPSPPGPPKAKKVPKHTPEEIAAQRAVVEVFRERFKAKKGVDPKLDHKSEHAAAFTLAKTYGADEACAIVRRAFEDSFVVRSNSTLRYIASKADTWRGTAPTLVRGRPAPPKQQAAGDEEWLLEHQ